MLLALTMLNQSYSFSKRSQLRLVSMATLQLLITIHSKSWNTQIRRKPYLMLMMVQFMEVELSLFRTMNRTRIWNNIGKFIRSEKISIVSRIINTISICSNLMSMLINQKMESHNSSLCGIITCIQRTKIGSYKPERILFINQINLKNFLIVYYIQFILLTL